MSHLHEDDDPLHADSTDHKNLEEHRPAPIEKPASPTPNELVARAENKKAKNNADEDNDEEKSKSEQEIVSSSSNDPSPSSENAKSKRKAQRAFEQRDAEASRAEHEKQEPHGQASGDMVKSVVFGGLDGIMTIFAVVTAAAGGSGGGSWQIVLVFGLSNLVADAWAMGFGEFLGGMAELDQAVHEREREIWEFETNFEEEKEELKLIYMKRGYPEDDAQGIVDILSKNKDHFIDAMMKDELGISVDIDDFWGPVKSGATMFCSFCVFGLIPLLPYFAGKGGKGMDRVFMTSCALVGISLVLLGCVKGYLTNRPMAQMAIAMLFSGAVSGFSSFIVSNILAIMVE